jgi:hypothetical protein
MKTACALREDIHWGKCYGAFRYWAYLGMGRFEYFDTPGEAQARAASVFTVPA